MLKGDEFSVIVPTGGVKKGERFMGYVQIDPFNIPNRKWRDGACDCCSPGFFHPMCLYAFFCPLPVLGQVQSRLRLNTWGSPGKNIISSQNFMIMIIITVFYLIIIILYPTVVRPYYQDWEYQMQGTRLAVYLVYWIVIIFIEFLIVFAITCTRAAIRKRFKIPGNTAEDFICGCFCQFCTITQMARHTYEYEKYPVDCSSACCEKTGMSDSALKAV